MTANIGGIDRALRIILGTALIIWGVITGSFWGVLGLIFLITGIIRWCPLYLPFGLKTCKVKDLN
ncbi:MAG TPA: DUF2892 domain-containing protein [Thiomicrorhabdus sp.]|nr:DUF2892 domain-containing protein [Thiomicrorhabdus sp.]